MKNHRFLWLRNRTTNNRKCEKARNIKEKRTIEMFSTASRPPVGLPSSPRDNYFQAKALEPQRFQGFLFCCCRKIDANSVILSPFTNNLTLT